MVSVRRTVPRGVVGLGWSALPDLRLGNPTLFAAYEQSSGWSLILTLPQIASEASVGA